MSAHPSAHPEKTNPVLWTVVLVGFVAGVAWWFAWMYDGGVTHAQQHPLVLPTGATGPGEPDHAALIESMKGGNDEMRKVGKAIYASQCTACHGADGGTGINATARQFIAQDMLNGADPYSMYLTLAKGYNAMPAQGTLKPEEKYAVIHYIRESFFKSSNPDQYVEIDATYLAEGGPQGPFPAPGGAAAGPQVRGADFVLEVPVAGAMAARVIEAPLERYAAARERLMIAAASSEADVAEALRTIARDEGQGAFALALVAAAAEGPEALSALVTDPIRNRFQPVLAILPRERLVALSTRLQEGG